MNIFQMLAKAGVRCTAAEVLPVSPRQVTRWTSGGKLPCRLGRRAVRYQESVVLAFLCDHEIETHPEQATIHQAVAP